jgi:transposase
MIDFHDNSCGGHHFWRTTTYKILGARYFYPNLFIDVCVKSRACVKCQNLARKKQLKYFPLKPVMVSRPFQQWGLAIIGETHPTSSGQHNWNLTATDYFTKWIEAIPTRSLSHKIIISFLEDIMSIFGFPSRIVTNNVASFKAEPLIKFCEKYGIALVHSTLYHPHGNGLEYSSDKILIKIIKKLLEGNKKSWDSKLKFSLWADRVTTKRSLGISPFQLVYRVEDIFPAQITFPMDKFLQDYQGEHDDMVRKILQLVEVQ